MCGKQGFFWRFNQMLHTFYYQVDHEALHMRNWGLRGMVGVLIWNLKVHSEEKYLYWVTKNKLNSQTLFVFMT